MEQIILNVGKMSSAYDLMKLQETINQLILLSDAIPVSTAKVEDVTMVVDTNYPYDTGSVDEPKSVMITDNSDGSVVGFSMPTPVSGNWIITIPGGTTTSARIRLTY